MLVISILLHLCMLGFANAYALVKTGLYCIWGHAMLSGSWRVIAVTDRCIAVELEYKKLHLNVTCQFYFSTVISVR